MGNLPLVVKLKRSTGGIMVTLYMVFICLEQNKDGEKLHNLVHIGCTREWMVQWDSLYKLRDVARDNRIGNASIKAWKEWHYQLVVMDTAAGDGIKEEDKQTARLAARIALLLGNSDAVPEPGKKLLGVKLHMEPAVMEPATMESNITGPVTPPSTYTSSSTEFDLPLPIRLEIELSNETTDQAKKTIAGNLSELPYGPVQFWKLLSRYHTIAKSRFEEVRKILARETNEPAQLILDSKSDEVTIPSLVQEIVYNLDLVSQIVVEIEKEVLPSVGVDVILDLSSLVPNIFLRECRLWSMLNTKEFHCSTHLGQSFRQLEWAHVEAFPCCMFCKTTHAWDEVMNPRTLESVNIRLRRREDCPHSCAEVVTSGYCDYITHQGIQL
ncbi:unnamed protein product [Clonostachys byssicola]|uniref:Uncharacterized protein n=1 Tax=Clonostachys byssicola TaxID=160290 RepID=A0A9N9UY96_9HYPO|nr:unnamed protein product [Clonostachys byssicola]